MSDVKIRFIRKNGRIIPIGSASAKKQYDANRNSEAKKSLVLGAITGAVGHSAMVAHLAKAPKFALGLKAVAAGLVVTGIAHSAKAAQAAHKESSGYTLRPLTFLVHQGVQGYTSGAVQALGQMTLKHQMKAVFAAKEGLLKGAQKLHALAKPHSAAFAANKKFKAAKWVMSSSTPTRKLLK
jgi:hypothetical protein